MLAKKKRGRQVIFKYSSRLELILMATKAVSSKANQKKSTNSQISTTDMNDTPITEDELMKKETPINVNDVLRLKKSTKGILKKF